MFAHGARGRTGPPVTRDRGQHHEQRDQHQEGADAVDEGHGRVRDVADEAALGADQRLQQQRLGCGQRIGDRPRWARAGRRFESVSYRARAPHFANRRFWLAGGPVEGGADVRAVRADHAVAMTLELR